jgi:DNA invertase Pin-like site-specific DNA recombinase
MSREKKPPRDPNSAVAYLRDSSISPREEGNSFDTQLRVIVKGAEQNGVVLTDIYKERGCSGALRTRPVLEKMLSDLIDGESTVGTVLIASKTRLMRNAREFEALVRCLGSAGVVVISVE